MASFTSAARTDFSMRWNNGAVHSLLVVKDCSRNSLTQFNPGAYLLKLCCLLIHRCGEIFHSRFQFCNGRILFLHFAVLFEEFIEQHRVHCFVAYRVGLALFVEYHQVRIYLCHVLGQQTKLRGSLWVELFLVAEGDRLQRQDCFARLVHWLDGVLKTRRRSVGTQVTTGINYHGKASWHGHSIDAGDIGVLVRWFGADANLGRIVRATGVADIDIVTASGERSTGARAQGRVVATGGVTKKGIKTAGRVVVAGSVADECLQTISGTVAAVVLVKRRLAGGRVPDTRGIGGECSPTIGRVEAARDVAEERIQPGGRVVATFGVGHERTGPDSHVVVAISVTGKRRYTYRRIFAAGGVAVERISTGGGVVAAG